MGQPAIDGVTFAGLMADFAPFERSPALAVGVSGGRDSMALVLLADEWARDEGGSVTALIVDHDLRANSADEAMAARRALEGLGIEAEILRWRADKPRHGIQEAARAARHRLLFEACRARGVLHLLVAHHAEDQAETVAMRAARGSGPDGLAGMSALSEHRDVRLLRPLLAISRRRLTAFLLERGVPWIEDPSNSDPRFERARLRQAGGVAVPAGEEGPARTGREAALARLALEIVEVGPRGEVALDRACFADLPAPRAMALLGRLVQAIGGRDHAPRRARLHRACDRMQAAGDRGPSGRRQDFILAGCRIVLRQEPATRRPRWIIRPENGRKDAGSAGQPLVPAVFFACGGRPGPHLDCQPPATDQSP